MADKSGDRRSRRRGEQAPALGSLSRPTNGSGSVPRGCIACGSVAVTRLAMDLTDGTPVTFVSCQTCEHRAWFDAEGGEVAIEDVLSRSRRDT